MIPIIDGHLDLAYLAQNGVKLTEPSPDPDRWCVNLPALERGGVRLACATLFTELIAADREQEPAAWEYRAGDHEGARRAAWSQLEIYRALEAQHRVRIVRQARDLDPLDDDGPLRIVILMEGGDPIRDASDVGTWFDAGVRLIGPTWALGSRHAGGNVRPGPLTDLGRELLDAMADRGLVLDVSHLSDAAFDEALERFPGIVVASHSNCRALLEPTERHLRDEQIRRISERDGLIGLNLFGRFLASGRPATVDDALRHLERMRALTGMAQVALGSDFDGGFSPRDCPEGVRRPEDLHAFLGRLAKSGWSDVEVGNFASGAWLRILRRALPE